ncbi:MAG: immunoglobulin domain-containing protein [Verrucomicrobia bacterium]|nr:immunoglobulin domain-containing protein [Verrucomicrobiota bacterium]
MSHRRGVAALPALVLSLALQCAPLCRQFLATCAGPGSPLSIVLRWTAGAVAVLGSCHAVSGATTYINSAPTKSAVNGTKFNYTITTAGYAAYSWGATNLPPNFMLVNNHLTNSTPNVLAPPGVYSVYLRAFEGLYQDGGATPWFTLTLTITGTYNAPVITVPPQNVITLEDTSAQFAASVTGVTPLTFKWFKDGTPLGGSPSTNYNIPVVTPDLGGVYTLIVTNAYGAATNGAGLTVIRKPQLTVVPNPPSQVMLQFNYDPNGVYSLEYCDKPGATNWQFWQDITGVPYSTIMQIPAPLNTTSRYYRVRMLDYYN